jgi:hypothetical protein
MPERGKLFHAIVGLGLAAGCGGEIKTASGDGGLGDKVAPVSDASAMPDSGPHDAAQERILAADVGKLPLLEAAVDAPAMTIDANMARDAAQDVTIPPPPEIK